MKTKPHSIDIAHVKQNADGAWLTPHTLDEHLAGTAEKAAAFAQCFESRNWGYLLGYIHDVGKSTKKWQAYLRRKSGYDEFAHLEGKVGILDHSTPGAKLSQELFGKEIGRLLGYCIAGHHTGMPDWDSDKQSGGSSALSYRLENTSTSELASMLREKLKSMHPGSPPCKFDPQSMALSFWIRMLFSCLVDADFLDTEAYMEKEKTALRGEFLSMDELTIRFERYIKDKTATADPTQVNRLRHEVLTNCIRAASQSQGIFSLTVPTGGGKTLSSLAFALNHARKHRLQRIIYVIPYTSIIEQNADVFQEVLGADQIVEHHSNLDDDDSTPASHLASENWDAPIVVTTSVQFFESLFAARTSRCRKLHNIAGSVVVLDEAQLLPVEFLAPILEVIELLSRRYRVSFLLATATQPAFESRHGFRGLTVDSIKEISSNVPDLYASLQRVAYEMPSDWDKPLTYETLAEDLSKHDRVLCIVSDRKSCRRLHQKMPPGTYHLSALMCGQHRSDTIKEIKRKLAADEPVRLISTQLVEAGVDLDFPVVYRSLAGLDSIAQAAGRCNREGLLAEPGKVVVFLGPDRPPLGILRKAADTTLTLLKTGLVDPAKHSSFNTYFSQLYWKANSLDAHGIADLLRARDDLSEIQFRTAGRLFQLIDDQNQTQILVPYDEGDKWIRMLASDGPKRWLLRKLQRYCVNIYNRDFEHMQKRGSVELVSPGIYALSSRVEYSDNLGLLIEENPDDQSIFIA